jgi:hypothetical protein
MQNAGFTKLSLSMLGILAAALGALEVNCSSDSGTACSACGAAGAGGAGGEPQSSSGGGGTAGMGGGGGGGAPCVPTVEICGNGVDEDCNGSDAPVSACLVSHDLIVRYFLDDIPSGELADSGPEPRFPLAKVDPASELSSVDVPGHRGLAWSAVGGDARVSAGFPNTSSATSPNKMLFQGGQLTLEMAASVVNAGGIRGQVQPFPSRLLYVGTATGESGKLSLSASELGTDGARWLVFSMDISTQPMMVGAWSAPDAVLSKPSIVHLVLDAAATEGDSVSLYLNGELLVNQNVERPPSGYSFEWVQPMWYLVLGNKEAGGRSFEGSISYVAMYGKALSGAEIATNTALLQQSDDGG